MLETFVSNGAVTLLALAVLGLELALIVVLPIARGRRPNAQLIANGLSGLFLILALRAALLDQGSGPVALFLCLAGAAHLGDVILHLRGSAAVSGVRSVGQDRANLR